MLRTVLDPQSEEWSESREYRVMSNKVGSVSSKDNRRGSSKSRDRSQSGGSKRMSKDQDTLAKEAKKGNLKKGHQSSDNIIRDHGRRILTDPEFADVKPPPFATQKSEPVLMRDSRVKVTFMDVDVEEIVREAPSRQLSQNKKQKSSKLRTATEKLQRLLLKPFDYDANLS